jgi:ribonucleoside-diphosphate reductase alpha chain
MASIIKVTKRDGSKVAFDVIKIKKVIEWACEGTKVNPLVLESHIQGNTNNNMETENIQEMLINSALALTKINEDFSDLDWRIVAARLRLLNFYKKAKRTQGYDSFGYGPYHKFVKKAVKAGIYDKKITDEYSDEELKEFGSEIDVEYDKGYDYAAVSLMKKRYLMKLDGEDFELPQQMYATIALLMAIPEKKKDRLRIAKAIYHATASRKISYATPIILNLRRPSGNLASCFITAMDDSLDSIYYTLDQLGQISKNAGGVGVNISRVRSEGARIKNIKGASGGVLPWVKLINDTAVAVNQLGSRAGAITVALDVWHRDIEEFLTMQHENGDQRKKAYDVFPQVVLTNLFMQRVENNAKWTLLDPHEVRSKLNIELAELYGEKFDKVYQELEKNEDLESRKQVDAKSIMKEILKTTVETGLPYVFFKENTNETNPNKHSGMIGNANLCTESFSNFSPSKVGPKHLNKDGTKVLQDVSSGHTHTCNLVSLNWAQFESIDDAKRNTRLAVRILDNTIEVSAPPLPEAQRHNNEYRILGVGSLGFADYLAKRGIPYSNAADEADKVFEHVALAGIDESANLAKLRGTYKYYEGSDWSKGKFFGRGFKWFNENSQLPKEWKELRKKVKEQGMRNGGIFAIAPNTSTSLMMGATASVLPIYRKFFVDKASNGAVPVCPPFLNKETFWTYQENQNVDQQKVIEVCSRIQKWTDQGISMELVLNMKNGMKAKDIYNLYLNAWKKGCKTVYYIRSITATAESQKEECISCSG